MSSPRRRAWLVPALVLLIPFRPGVASGAPMSREARGAALVVALFGLFLLTLVVRRRLDEGAAPAQGVEAVQAASHSPLPVPPTGEPDVVASPASEQPGDGAARATEAPPPEAPAQGAPGPSTLTLRGRVVDAAGRPVAGATVVCWKAEPREVTSAADGSFACEGIAPGELGPRWSRVDLEVSDATARVDRHGIVVGADQPPVEVVLRPTTRLRVRVRSSGATVHLRGVLHADGARPRTSQAEGELDLECHEGDWVDVTAVAPGHAPRRFALRAPSPEVVVHLSRVDGGGLRGRVVEHDGSPARRIHLRVRSGAGDAVEPPTRAGAVEERPLGRLSGEGLTRDDGSFTIDGLAEGARVRLLVSRESDDPMLRPGTLDGPGLAVEAKVGEDDLLVTLPRRGAHRLRLRAVAVESGQPLVDAGVGPPWSCAPGGAPGGLLIDLPGPGEHTLQVTAPGRLARSLKVTLDGEETRDLGDVPLDLPGHLRLALRWPEAPIDAAWLTWTDARGAPGRHDLTISASAIVPCGPGSRGFALRARRPGGLRHVASFETTVVAGRETPVEVDLTSAPLVAE